MRSRAGERFAVASSMRPLSRTCSCLLIPHGASATMGIPMCAALTPSPWRSQIACTPHDHRSAKEVLAFFVQCKKNIVKYRQLAIPALVVAMSAMSCRHAQIPLSVLPASLSSDATGRGEVIVRDVAVCGGCHAADSRNPDGPLIGGKEFQNWRN